VVIGRKITMVKRNEFWVVLVEKIMLKKKDISVLTNRKMTVVKILFNSVLGNAARFLKMTVQ
jgi:hypothetical protein